MATKYVSALDGGQMDSALMDMATHTSEAWAVGTRNGTPVSGSDVTYHNNSKYWADSVYGYTERAEDAAARAEAAVPAGTAGAVFFDRAQSLTTAQQMQAKANISAGGTNPNLLDNSWWGSNEVVNQRNTTSAPSSNGLYTIDRWIWTSGSLGNTWGIGATGITITIASSSVWYSQKNPNPSAINGKTVTGSVLLSDGTIYSGSATFSSGTAAALYDSTPLRIYLDSGGNFTLRIASTITVRAVKLELGSVSTLANDAPPDYGTELIKCRGYFERIHSLGSSEIVGMGMGVSASSVRIGIPSLICHTIQSVTYSGGGLLLEGGGNYRTLTSIGRLNATPKNGFLTVTCGSSDAITLYQTYALVGTAAGGYIDISADL